MAEVLAAAVLAMDFDGTDAVAGLAQTESAAERTERAIASSAGRMADNLAGIGAGAQRGATAADRATKQLQSSIERATAALSAGARGTAGFFESLAKQRGANVDTLRPFLDQLTKVKDAQDQVAQAALLQAEKQRSAAAAVAESRRAFEQADAAREAYLAKLREEIKLLGMSEAAQRAYRAAQANRAAGGGSEGSALLAILDRQRAIQEKAAQAARDEAAAQKEAARAKQQAESAANSFIAGLQREADAIGKTRIELLEMEAARHGITTQAAPYITRLREAEKSTNGLTISSGQAAAAMRQLPAQFTDIATQLAGGASPFLVLLQQGGQVKDSFGGLGNAAKSLATLLTPLRVAIGGIGAILAVAAFAYKKGADEQFAFTKSLVLTGNASGKTAGQLDAMAQAISGIAGTRGKAAEVLTEMVNAGGVAGSVLQRAAEEAIKFERAGGQAVSETAKQFSELGKDPLQAAAKLSEKTGFLTRSIYEQIKALQESGNTAQAAQVAQTAYADALANKTGQLEGKLGTLEKAWRSVGDVAKLAWDKMLNIGRPQTIEDAIKEAEASLAAAEKRFAGKGRRGGTTSELRGGGDPEEVKAARDLLATRKEGEVISRRTADNEAARKAQADALAETEGMITSSLSSQAKLAKDLTAARTRMEVAGRDPEQIQATLTAITQGSAAFAQSTGAAMAKIDGGLQSALDASKAQQDQLRRQSELGLVSQFGLERELAALQLKDNQAQLDALKARTAQVSKQREPLVELLKIENERNALIRERKALLDAEARVIADMVKLGERRQQSPNELFRISERQSQQTTDEGDQSTRLQLKNAIFDQAIALRDSNRELSLEAGLIGKSSDQRSVAVEQLRIQIQLEEQLKQIRANFPIEPRSGLSDEESQRERERLQKARNDAIAGAQKNAASAMSNVATKANIDYIADLLDPTRAKTFGEALTAAFEGAGNSLVKLINTFETFAAARIASEERLKAIRKDPGLDEETRQKGIAAAIEEQTKTQISAYATMAGAAKGFFKENSKGYKTLETIETGFRLAQIAGAIQVTATKLFGLGAVTTATIAEEAKRQVALEAFRASELAADAAHATASIAQSQAVGAASVAPAIAKEGSQSGLYGAIAMAALLAAIGYASGAFGKSRGGATQASASQRQGGAATGRIVTTDQLDPNSASFRGGTVFGDSEARSESISKSIDVLKDVARLELPIARSQLNALEAIRDSMAGLANLVVRSVGGAITTGKNFDVQTGVLSKNKGDPILGLAGINDSGLVQGLANSGSILGKIGVFAQSLWGKVTQKIADSGLEVSGTISDLLVRQFVDIEKTSSSFFGLKKSTTTDTQFTQVEDQLARQFGLIFSAIGDTIKTSASLLGREGGDALAKAIESFPVAIERLSLKDLKGQELQDKISAAIGAQADTIAEALVPGLKEFINVGEGYYETLVRVSSGIELANYQLDLLNVTAIAYTDVIRKQGDIGAEIVRQSIALAETADGALSSVGAIVNTLSGTADELADTYRSLIDVRTALIKVGESGNTLTEAMIRGAGGLDKLSGSLDTYFTKFFSEQEQLSANANALASEFGKLGLAVPLSREEFRNLVRTLNDGTDAGAAMAAKVLGLAGAFDEVAAAAEKAASKLTDSISEATKRFGTPQERQGAAFGGIAKDLGRDAGLSFSISQLVGASRKDIEDFARAFIALTTVSDDAKAAVLDAASALADLKDQASSQRSSLEIELLRAQGRELDAVTIERQAELDQLRNLEGSLGVAAGSFTKLQEEIYAASDAAKVLSGLDNVISDFLKGEDLAKFRAGRIQQTLAGGGITGITIEQIMGATTDQIVELWNSVGDAGKQAILDSYGLLNQLQTDLTKEQSKALQDQLAGMKGLRDLSKDIKQFISSVKFGDLSPLSAEAQLTEARKLFDTTFSKAQGGDTNAQGQLLSNAQAYLQELQSAFASGPGFTAEFNRVTSMLDALGKQGDALDPQIKYLESLSDNSRDMLDALLSIDTTLKGGQASVGGASATGQTGSGGGGGGGSNAGVVDVTPMQGAEASKQTELLMEQVKQLTAAVAELKALNTVSNAGVATQQAAAKQTGQKLDALLVPLDRMASTAQSSAAKAAVMR